MSEHKFTDDVVIKALECCSEIDREFCDNCTFRNEEDCVVALAKNALDLINRQKAEIERLREIRDLCNTTILEKSELIEKLKISDASKEECTIRQHGEIKELKSEIERLNFNLKAVLDERADHSEAVKEFAERLRGVILEIDDTYIERIVEDGIDNLVKEMTEGKE